MCGKPSTWFPHRRLVEQERCGSNHEYVIDHLRTLFDKDFKIKDQDSIFFLNFRPDRAIQLTLAFNLDNFSEFKRSALPSYYLCMTPYVPDEIELPILFDKEKIKQLLSKKICLVGIFSKLCIHCQNMKPQWEYLKKKLT